MKDAVLLFDGGSRGNPGPSGCGFVIMNNDETEIIAKGSEFLGKNTNNYAEYMGVILGMKKALELHINNLIIKGDSQLVIKQLLKEYSVKSPNLIPLYSIASKLILQFNNVRFNHIKRKLNVLADKLANEAMDQENDWLE